MINYKEQTLSNSWGSIVEQSNVVPGEGEKDKPTDGDDDDKDDPEGGGGGDNSNNDQEEPPEGGDDNDNTENPNLSKSDLNHATKKHMPSKFVQQLSHLSREAAENKISTRTFFNLKWTEEQVIEALTLGYAEALSKGYVSGTYTFTYLGESIVIALENGKFVTGFGLNSYTYDELYELFLLLGGE